MCKEKCNDEKCLCNDKKYITEVPETYCDCGSDDESLQCSCEFCK